MTIARSVVLFYTDRNTTPVSVVVTCPGNNKSFHKSHKVRQRPTIPPQRRKAIFTLSLGPKNLSKSVVTDHMFVPCVLKKILVLCKSRFRG